MLQVPASARVIKELRARLTVEEVAVAERVFRIVKEVLEGQTPETPAPYQRAK